MTLTVPARMGFLSGRSSALFLCVAVFLVCSCEKHRVGEYPEVQRELADVIGQRSKAEVRPPEPKAETAATVAATTSPTPAAKPTPAEFFPTHPR